MQPTDELYFEYAGVITRVVSRYAWKFPDLEDDLYLQAGLIFCKACLTYDPDNRENASFATWLEHKLHDLTTMIDKACNGPCSLKGRGAAALPMDVLERESEDGERMEATYTGDSLSYVERYCRNLKDFHSSEYPDSMLPFIRSLEGDALQVFQDFVASRLELGASRSHKKSRQHRHLNPMRIFLRRYRGMGWTYERTRKAWQELTEAMMPYAVEAIPGMVGA